MRRFPLGITLEEAQQVEAQLLSQQRDLQDQKAALAAKKQAELLSAKTTSDEITTQTTSQITEAQAAERAQIEAAQKLKTRGIILALVGSGLAVGTFIFVISRQNKR